MASVGPDETIAPGVTLAVTLAEFQFTIRMAARVLDMDEPDLEVLLAGYAPVTGAIARRLQAAFGVHADVWLLLERNYRRDLKAGKRDMTHANDVLPPHPDRGNDHPAGRGEGDFRTDY